MNTPTTFLESWIHALPLLTCKGTLLALIVGASVLAFRRHLSPAWRHGLWLLVLLRFVVPDVGHSPLSLTSAAGVPDRFSSPVAEVPASKTEMEPPGMMTEDPIEALESAAPARLMPADVNLPNKPVPLPSIQPAAVWSLEGWLASIWLAGAATLLGSMGFLHLRLHRRLTADIGIAEKSTDALLREACQTAGMRVPRLIITDAVRAPSLWGVLRPAILLPRQVARESQPEALRLILLHELAHLRRMDLWAQLAAALVLTLHWFNPIVWIAIRRLRAEAEMAADARALQWAEPAEAHRLGQVLLGLATRASATSWLAALLSASLLGVCEDKNGLKRRLEALLDIARGRRTRWTVGLALFSLLSLAGLSGAPAQEKPQEPESSTAQPPDPSPVEAGVAAPRASSMEQPAPNSAFSTAQVTIVGTVVSKEDGKPLAGAQVISGHYYGPEFPPPSGLIRSISASGSPATTDDAGSYILDATLFRNQGVLLIHAPGKEVAVQFISNPEKTGTLRLRHQLASDQGIRGTVVDAQGRPVQGAKLMLSGRSAFLMEDPLRQHGFLHARTETYWVGEPVTATDGSFHGHSYNRAFPDQEWLIVTHPLHGIAKVRLSQWQQGGRLALEPWAVLEGQALDAEGSPIADAQMDFGVNDFLGRAGEAQRLSISQPMKRVTDAEGRFRLEGVLPGVGSMYAKWKDTYFDFFLPPLNPGETQQTTLRPRPPKPTPSARDLRDIVGRIIPPAGRSIRSKEHEVRLSLQKLGESQTVVVNEPDVEGRFWTRPQPPGDYVLTVWVSPKDKKLNNAPNSGFSRRFILEKDAANAALVLGEMPLREEDFAFIPAKTDTKVKAVRRADQPLDNPVEDAASYATWAASGGGGVTQERPLDADGKVRGIAPVTSSGYFIIRATRADGSRHYSQVLKDRPGEKGGHPEKLVFTPGVALKGKVSPPPAGTAHPGWVLAAVRVKNPMPVDSTRIGWIPTLTWHAWVPLAEDGSYHFSSLPAGDLSLVAFGDGWSSFNERTKTPEITTRLTADPAAHELPVPTLPTFAKNLRLVLPDGSPLAKATVSLVQTENTGLPRAWGRWSSVREPANEEAYKNYTSTPIPGHSATTDESGHATLRNLFYKSYGDTEAEVKWTDAKSGKAQTARIKFRVGLKARETITASPGG